MGRVLYAVSMSLDGFVAGKNQSVAHPLGEGGERLHDWMRALAAWRAEAGLKGGETNASSDLFAQPTEGAVIMGRNMFGGGPGPWGEPPWQGWWGPEPPFHVPVFVLTHHRRPPLELRGGTTFTFVTDGIESALRQAKRAAGDRDVAIGGGGHTAAQYLAAGRVDQMRIHLVPVLLGEGVRLLDLVKGVPLRFQQSRVLEAPGVTHLTYDVALG